MYKPGSNKAKTEAQAKAEVGIKARKTVAIGVKILLPSIKTLKTSLVSLFLLVKGRL